MTSRIPQNPLKTITENAENYIYCGMTKLCTSPHTLNSLSLITPYLYITSRETATNIPQLLQNRVGVVISVSMYNVDPQTKQNYTKNNIQYIHFPMEDQVLQSLYPVAEQVNIWLQQFVPNSVNKGTVLNKLVAVHCDCGISRSVSIVIWHLIRTYKWTYEQAVQWIQRHRYFVRPNDGFKQQLVQLSNWQQQQKKQ